MAASISHQLSVNEAAFEKHLIQNIRHFRLYEDKYNQMQALARVPLDDLKAIAEAKLDSTPTQTTKTPLDRDNILKDMLLREMMEWFKTEFFSWMDSPKCPRCKKVTTAIGSGVPSTSEMQMSAGRVELFTCRDCFRDNREVARFPRYNDPVVLMDTRTGRCGEWANCFALICRAVGFEVRHVYDHTDHVWVEIFSASLTPNRWVHVDPCENSYDSPLLYEAGWGKKLTYIVAVSQDDIQDVTGRYSRNFKQVLERRLEVRESWLASTILRLRRELQKNLPEGRKSELERRWVQETVDLFTSGDFGVKSSEMVGRESGSLAWRLARQELGDASSSNSKTFRYQENGHIWRIDKEIVEEGGGKFRLFYDCELDTYFSVNKEGNNVDIGKGWRFGAWSHEEIFRKQERDWKMVYLAPRNESSSRTSRISWKFQVEPGFRFQGAKVDLKYSIFQSDAKLSVKFVCDGESIDILETNQGDQVYSWSSKSEHLTRLQNCRSITVECQLTSGAGAQGWQKVQLFRQNMTNVRGLVSEMSRNLFAISFDISKD